MEIFKNVLRLPYVSFSEALTDLNGYHKGLWALGKLHTYRLQTEPFCHVDGDVFFFGPVLDPLLEKPVFCQSFDHNMAQYAEIHPYVHQNFERVPTEFKADLSTKMKYINAGVLGGSDLDLFQLYTSRAFELIDHNQDKFDKINSGLLNLYYEQFLLSNIITDKNIAVATLYPDVSGEEEHDFAAFHAIPHRSNYVHLISHLKKTTAFMEIVVARLQLEFPDYYRRLAEHYKVNAV